MKLGMAAHEFEKKMVATGTRANMASLVSVTTCPASLVSLVSVVKG